MKRAEQKKKKNKRKQQIWNKIFLVNKNVRPKNKQQIEFRPFWRQCEWKSCKFFFFEITNENKQLFYTLQSRLSRKVDLLFANFALARWADRTYKKNFFKIIIAILNTLALSIRCSVVPLEALFLLQIDLLQMMKQKRQNKLAPSRNITTIIIDPSFIPRSNRFLKLFIEALN